MLDYSYIKDKKHVWISLSGGVDSALVFYLITKYFYENNLKTKIQPWCTVDTTRLGNDNNSRDIIKAVKSIIPYEYISPLMTDSITVLPGDAGDKATETKPHWERMRKSGKYDLFITGLSSVPPESEMKATPGFFESYNLITTEDRTKEVKKPEFIEDPYINGVWHPLRNWDKSQIADAYDELDLMDTVFPLTASCVDRVYTPCMKCFWCHEKYWAFGLYDMTGGAVKSAETIS